jgi:asparagine N-glycosylation enzyme membrane subunit Stt3
MSDVQMLPAKFMPYPYQKRPVVANNEDDSTEENLLFHKTRKNDPSQQRAQTAPERMNHRNLTTSQHIDSRRSPADNFNTTTPVSQISDFVDNLSTSGQEVYVVDGVDLIDHTAGDVVFIFFILV